MRRGLVLPIQKSIDICFESAYNYGNTVFDFHERVVLSRQNRTVDGPQIT